MKLHTIATAIFAIAVIAVATAAGAGNTTASFSDQVTSNGNTFTAGTLYMQLGADCGSRTYGGFPGNKGVDNGLGCGSATNATVPTTSLRPTGTAVTASPAFTITNVGSLAGTLSTGTVTATSTDYDNCPYGGSNFFVTANVTTSSLAAGASSTANTLSATVPTTSPNACQGVTFNVHMPFNLLLAGSTDGTTKFSDQVTATGNMFSLDELPAPVSPLATADTGGTQVTFTWASATGDFATSWNVARQSGTGCTNWTPSSANIVATGVTNRSYIDTTVTPGTTYCYAAQGVFHNWLSPFSGTSSASPTVPAKDLYIHGDNTLGDNPDTGSWTLPKGTKGTPTIWTSETSNYAVESGAAWVTGAWSLSLPAGQYDGSGLTITVWMSPTAGTCTFSDSSSTSNKLATAVSDGPVSGAIVLNPNTAFTARTGTICLGIAPHDNGHAQTFTSWGSYIQGPFS